MRQLSWCGRFNEVGSPSQARPLHGVALSAASSGGRFIGRSGGTVGAELPVLPGDELQGKIDRFAAFDRLLSCLETFASDFGEAQRQLHGCCPVLLEALGGAFKEGDDLSWFDGLVTQLTMQLNGWAERLRKSCAHVEAIDAQLASARSSARAAGAALRARAEAWPPKKTADKEAEALLSRFGRNHSIEEKKELLQAKHQADERWRKFNADAVQALDAALEARRSVLAGALSELCGCLSGILLGAQPAAEELGRLSQRFFELGAGSAGGLQAVAVAGAPAGPERVHRLSARRLVATVFGGEPAPAPLPLEEEFLTPGTAAAAVAAAVAAATAAAAVRSAPSAMPLRYAAGEHVEVWSESEGRWLSGVVDRIFDEAGEDNGYSVPAGILRITHAYGTKYVRQDQVQEKLRRPPPGGPV